jgi:hypothetical protein
MGDERNSISTGVDGRALNGYTSLTGLPVRADS